MDHWRREQMAAAATARLRSTTSATGVSAVRHRHTGSRSCLMAAAAERRIAVARSATQTQTRPVHVDPEAVQAKAAVAAVLNDLLVCEESRVCVRTFKQLVDNVVKFPDNVRYRQIKCTNSVVQQRLLKVPGGADLLWATGWALSNDGEVWSCDGVSVAAFAATAEALATFLRRCA
eukprot:TRINITY_DN9045_c2_g1_i1.p1 TRINITY_DN9045_c2_g1~~TRINITY_DN9045_c2_g1_i1.p1  ORF type:complete len:176 (+),score=7.73 TRINITY_DN9045_c2_g1_i1:63-590(+)